MTITKGITTNEDPMPANDWLQLHNRACLVAGAGGLGGECAASLGLLGARVVLVDIDESHLDSVRRRAELAGAPIATVAADLRDAERCRSVVAEAAGQLGGIDVFVHAVGRNVRRPILELVDDDWSQIITLNLSTAYWLGQAVGRIMCDQQYGRMVFVSSVAGLLAHADHAPYATSKSGLNQLVRAMAREWAPRHVNVNAVAPGYVETDLTRDHLDKDGVRAALTALVPAGRLGCPGEVADAVMFLASDRARFVTGQILYVDGGRVLV